MIIKELYIHIMCLDCFLTFVSVSIYYLFSFSFTVYKRTAVLFPSTVCLTYFKMYLLYLGPVQEWTYNRSRKTIQNHVTTCLEGRENQVVLRTCTFSSRQQWDLTDQGIFKLQRLALCLTNNYAQVELQPCDPNNSSQKWMLLSHRPWSVSNGRFTYYIMTI